MSHAPVAAPAAISEAPLKIATALRESLAGGFRLADLRADLMAGAVVGVVALPLSMALAIASGVPPQHGLYTAIVAGFLIALLGGSRVQVSGPTAAFVVILAPISAKFGVGGLLMATLMAGVLLVLMGVARLGRLIEFIPYPVTTGFTAGIAVVIGTLQIKDFLGLTIDRMPDHFFERIHAIATAIPTLRMPDLAVGLVTLSLLVLFPRITRRVPSPLVALPVGAIVAVIVSRYVAGWDVVTISDRFSYVYKGVTHAGIPQTPPQWVLPWTLPGPDGRPLNFDLELIRSLGLSAFAIAMLGAIESLLSAVVADGMTGTKHDPDAELAAQGFGNIIAPFFGGLAATGALARTATNVRSGARSPIAAAFHAVFVLLAVLLFSPLLGYLPMASMAALLLVVAWNMSEAKHFMHVLRVAPRSDTFVLLTCFGLTIVFDMVISVSVGVVLAALLFMRRMSELADVKLVAGHHPELAEPLPDGVLVYEIAGPLFFGAAQKAMSELRTITSGIRCVVIDLSDVPVIDATGLVNLESAIERLHKARIRVILGGVNGQPMRLFVRAGWRSKRDRINVFRSFNRAVALARETVRTAGPSPARKS